MPENYRSFDSLRNASLLKRGWLASHHVEISVTLAFMDGQAWLGHGLFDGMSIFTKNAPVP